MNDDAIEAHKETSRGIPLTRFRASAGVGWATHWLCSGCDKRNQTFYAGPFSSGICEGCQAPTMRAYCDGHRAIENIDGV